MNLAQANKKQTDAIIRQRELSGRAESEVVGGGVGGADPTISTPSADLTAHKASGDHDSRYAQVFTDLNDAPAAYTGAGGKIVAVKADTSGLELISVPAGGSGAFDFGLITVAVDITQDWGSLA